MQGEELLRRLDKVVPLSCDVYLYSIDSHWCRPVRLPSLYILNTDLGVDSGEHFVSFYVAKDKSCTYFDSFGFGPRNSLRDYWTQQGFRPVRYSQRLLQDPFSETCAFYQIAFASLITNGGKLRDFLALLTDNTQVNDRAIIEFVKKLPLLAEPLASRAPSL